MPKFINFTKSSLEQSESKTTKGGQTYFRQEGRLIELDANGELVSMTPNVFNVEKLVPEGDYEIDMQCLVKEGYNIRVGFIAEFKKISKQQTKTAAAA